MCAIGVLLVVKVECKIVFRCIEQLKVFTQSFVYGTLVNTYE